MAGRSAEPAAAGHRRRRAWRLSKATERLQRVLDAMSLWRMCASAWFIGALAAASLPPIHAMPVLAISLGGLVLLIDRTSNWKQAILLGWCFAFGYFVAGIYWLANALLSVASEFGWLLPFAIAGAVGGLSAFLACFPAIAVGISRAVWPAGPARLIVLAIAWTVCEWLRARVFTGFPWNPIGSGWAFSDAMIQFAAVAGIWGMCFLTVAVAALPALLIDWSGPAGTDVAVRRRPIAALFGLTAGAAVLIAVWIGGSIRLSGASEEEVPGVRLRLVQANIAPGEKGANERSADLLDRHIRLTADTPDFAATSHAIWAETASPFPFERYPDARDAVRAAVPPGGLLITGVIRTEPASGPPREIWNSLAAIDTAGRVVDSYDKFHLVPFGEYVPLHNWLPFISKFTPGIFDFSAGPGPRTLRLPGLPPVGPLICYEVIFPGNVVDPKDRPDWLLNLTNDGWYGISTGPYQHFVSAQFRAVEEGLPLVRVANTGVSAVVDPYGRVLDRTLLGKVDVVDAALPRPLVALTPYARWGDWTAAVLLAAAAAGALLLRRVG